MSLIKFSKRIILKNSFRIQGGPVILPVTDFIPQNFEGGSCQAESWSENIPFCQSNKQQCDRERNECYELILSRGTQINHHCNAALVFAIITCKIFQQFLFLKLRLSFCDDWRYDRSVSVHEGALRRRK